MQYRTMGKSGLQVSEIGFGAWGIGKTSWIGADDNESLRALHRAIDLGLTFIDTAYGYGEGHSERLIGQALREREGRVYVATKIPPKNRQWPAAHNVPVSDTFPGNHIREYTERSLRNLGVDMLDVQQFHVWSDTWMGQGDWQETVEQLKSEGKIRAFGVSINDHEPNSALQLVRSGVVDVVQVIYNIFDQSPEDELFPACQEHNVGVIARVPFDEGALTGTITPDTTFPPDDWRNNYFAGDRKREVYERVTAMANELGIPLDQLPEVALRYILSHPAVSTVIPGMRQVRNVERNMAVGDGQGLPDAQVQQLKQYRWVRNFYRS
jgi:aryl-alcohol dehydrogenase-like predicted oxidoreductase